MATAKYTPIGDTLNPAVAIIQAANALDIAAQFAVASRDTDSLIRVSREWIELSGRLAYDDEEGDEESGHSDEGRSFGFSVVSDIEEKEDEE